MVVELNFEEKTFMLKTPCTLRELTQLIEDYNLVDWTILASEGQPFSWPVYPNFPTYKQWDNTGSPFMPPFTTTSYCGETKETTK